MSDLTVYVDVAVITGCGLEEPCDNKVPRVHSSLPPNGILIGSSVFAQPVCVSSALTDRATCGT